MNLVVSHWSANPVVPAPVAVVAAMYLRGYRMARPEISQTAAFSAGLLLVVVALVSPAGYWALHHIWVRSVPLPRVMLITGTLVSETVLAMMLAFGSGLLYPGYLPAGYRPGSVPWDQQLGGAVLWVLALPPLMITIVALLIRWLNEENRQALATGLDRLLRQSNPAWPSRPGRM